jgi:ribonucleoside-diphosphate reductase subunit M1
MAIVHPDYTLLANRVSVDALHKRTSSDIREVATLLYEFKDKAGRPAPLLCERTFKNIMQNADKINAKIDYSRDYNYDFFGFKTLERAYLLKVEGKISERP